MSYVDLLLSHADFAGKSMVHISAVPLEEGKRRPSAFVCVLDISGSMGTAATINSGNESHGFSRLDLVKHSVNTIINVLEPQDYLSIISFSNNAVIELPLTSMNDQGKTKASTKLNALQPTNSTNLWAGIQEGMEMAKNPKLKEHNVVTVVLTDGEPNMNPKEGIVGAMQNYLKKNQLFGTVNTFGFGYQLDSQLLTQISNTGNGSYAYIPDCTFVGTIFVNFMSNTLAAMSISSQLDIKALNGTEILKVHGYSLDKPKNGQHSISLGPIQFGQSRDVICIVKLPKKPVGGPYLSATLRYGSGQSITKELVELQKGNNDLYYHYARLLVSSRIIEAMEKSKSLSNSRNVIKATIDELKTLPCKDEERSKALLRDMESSDENEAQVYKSLEKDEWYRKWGEHFLPSIAKAHLIQQCNNFKDPGVQLYGGKLFKEMQDIADAVFCKLPAPTPSVASYDNSSSAPVTNMSAYYNYAGSCFDGEGDVSLADGFVKKVHELRKGDRIQNGNASHSVLCVIKFKTNRSPMVDLNGMKITPYHPVRVQGEWKFPCEIAAPSANHACDYVYNLVLSEGHVVSINDVECVTLGHGFDDNAVIRHPYFGTERVIHDLQKLDGWTSGYIEMENHEIIRDRRTGLVSSISHANMNQ